MSYAVAFTPRADDELSRLPPLLASQILDALDRLAEDPVGLSRASTFPYLPGRQLYQFWAESEGKRHWLTVFFQYAQDEQQIIILEMAVQTMG